MEVETLYIPKEVMARLRISRQSLRRLTLSGQLEGKFLPHAGWRYRPSAIEAFIAARPDKSRDQAA